MLSDQEALKALEKNHPRMPVFREYKSQRTKVQNSPVEFCKSCRLHACHI